MIRIGIADDSRVSRRWLTGLLEETGEFVVVGEASDGEGAIALARDAHPDVLVMDLAMPRIDGAAATRVIMERHPTPVIVLSGASNRKAGQEMVAGLLAGAFDAFEKPVEGGGDPIWRKPFLRSLRAAARVKPIRRSRHARKTVATLVPGSALDTPSEQVLVGASTGGPKVLAEMLSALPPLHVPLLVMVHFPDELVPHLNEYFAQVAHSPVVLAQDGKHLDELAGQIVLARGGRHLLISKNGTLLESRAPERNHCRPSIDVLFESATSWRPGRTLGVLLTGMGADGAAGLLEIHKNGGRTIVQDEASSAVFGMPRAAIELGAAQQVLPASQIARAIERECAVEDIR